jgi:membrane-bound metal-dependent hydrolase YbcI (DUF457 family)
VDNVTHTLFALTLARTPLARASRGATAVLVLSSNAPDIDIVMAARGGLASYLQWHRGPTHGALGVLGLGLLTAAIVRLGYRLISSTRDRPPSFVAMIVTAMIGVSFHILMDLATPYGTRLLSPFDWRWFTTDWLPITDVYLLAVLIAALLFGRGLPDARWRNAAVALALAAAIYGVRGAAHYEAMTLAPRVFGPTLPPPCNAQPTATIVSAWPRATEAALFAPGHSRCVVEIAAIPTYLSPFRWRIIAQLSNAYELRDVDLLDGRLRTTSSRRNVRYPNVWTAAVDKAATTRTARVFLGFSRFPAARAFLDPSGVATVQWDDMRFVEGPITEGQPRLGSFSETVRIGGDGQIEERLGP